MGFWEHHQVQSRRLQIVKKLAFTILHSNMNWWPGIFSTDTRKSIDAEKTWWQSITMEGSQGVDRFPVNLTVNLGKTYDVTYIRLKFQSPRPASFAIYKKIRPDPALPGMVAKPFLFLLSATFQQSILKGYVFHNVLDHSLKQAFLDAFPARRDRRTFWVFT